LEDGDEEGVVIEDLLVGEEAANFAVEFSFGAAIEEFSGGSEESGSELRVDLVSWSLP
jgi:hypothetical protein